MKIEILHGVLYIYIYGSRRREFRDSVFEFDGLIAGVEERSNYGKCWISDRDFGEI